MPSWLDEMAMLFSDNGLGAGLFYLYLDVVSLIVPQGQGAAHDP